MVGISYMYDKVLPEEHVIALYSALKWSSADKPKVLLRALANSHTVISAWHGNKLVALGNAISDGYLVVYYPHLAVLPDYQGKGIGTEIVRRMKEIYADFHQQQIVADGRAIDFYKKCGFVRAGSCEPLWIYSGHDHD
jgi:GNAT superfamily N-acetyltransferase